MHLTDIEIEKLLKKVELKIKYLKMDISALEESTKPIVPENSLGRVTRMDAINKKGVNEQALRQARESYDKLTTALERLKNKDKHFGTCSKCKDEIPFQRLFIMPESAYCVKCAK